MVWYKNLSFKSGVKSRSIVSEYLTRWNELYVIIQYKDNTNIEQKVDFGINCYKKIAAKTQKNEYSLSIKLIEIK